MVSRKDRMEGMRALSKGTKQRVDEQLKDREVELLLRTSVDLNTLRPNVSDKESLEQLITAVNESRRKNETAAELKGRISALGKGVAKVVTEVSRLL